MMANVSGVSQFLETVGVPGPQAGPESVPGQNFAAVMQKAGDDAGSPLPTSTTGVATGQTDEEASSTGTAPSTQTPTRLSQKTLSQAARATQTPVPPQIAQHMNVGGQTRDSTRGAARLLNTVTVLASQTPAATARSAVPAQVTGGKAEATVSDTSLKTMAASMSTPLASGITEPLMPAIAAQGNDANALLAAPATVAVKATGTPFSSVQPRQTNAQKRVENIALAVNEAAKPTGGKVDSKLTAMVPQGTAGVPQSAASLPVADGAPGIALALPVAVPALEPSLSVEFTAPLVQTPLASSVQQLPAAPAGPVSGSSAGTVRGANGKQTPSVGSPSHAAFNTPVGAALTTPTVIAASAPPPSLDASLANASARQSAVMVSPAAQVPTGKAVSQDMQAAPLVAATSETPAALNTQVTQATPQPEVPTIAPPGQPVAAFQAALTLNGSPDSSAKPGPHVRSGLSPAKAAGDVATMIDPASSQAVPAKVAAPAASASPAPAVAPVQPSANHATTVTPTLKTPQKQAEASASAAAAPLAASLNSTPAADSAPATPTVKDAPGAAVPLVSAPAVAAPAEMAAVVSTAPAMPTQAPLVHGAAATSAPVVSGVAGTNFGAQETGAFANGSLPHTTLSATPTSLEVGVSSGTHGWLKIRAELNEAGQVDASLTGASSAAAAKLRGDLPALNSYLQGEKVQMGSLDVRSALHTAAFESGSTFSQAGSGGGANPSTGTAVSADASAAGGREQQPQPEANSVPVLSAGRNGDEILPGRVTDAAAYGNQTELDGAAGLPSVGYGAGGGWLNVRV